MNATPATNKLVFSFVIYTCINNIFVNRRCFYKENQCWRNKKSIHKSFSFNFFLVQCYFSCKTVRQAHIRSRGVRSNEIHFKSNFFRSHNLFKFSFQGKKFSFGNLFTFKCIQLISTRHYITTYVLNITNFMY